MSTQVGDLRVLMTADTTRFAAGLASSAAQARSFGGNLTSMLPQLSYAVQDFAAVLGQGGANSLGRALMSTANNVGMLGAAFGPWGAVIAGGAAVLSSTLIPKLLETKEALVSVNEMFQNGVADAKNFSDVSLSIAKSWREFDRSIKAASGESAEEMAKSLGLDEQDLQERLRVAWRNLNAAATELPLAAIANPALRNAATQAPNAEALGGMTTTQLQLLFKSDAARYKDVHENVQQYQNLSRELTRVQGQLAEARRAAGTLNKEERVEELGKRRLEGWVKEFDEREKLDQKLGKKQDATDRERQQRQLSIAEHTVSTVEANRNAVAAKIEAGLSSSRRGDLGAFVRGSSDAAAAIARQQTPTAANPELDALKAQKTILEQLLSAARNTLSEMKRKKNELTVVTIPN